MEVHASALKHGIDAASAVAAASTPAYVAFLDDDNPARQFLLGFDDAGRLLEIVIHAMKARPQYYELLP